MAEIKNIVNFIFEINQLKRQIHGGWQLAGVKHPGTIAEHSMRAAQIGYILAVMEGDANPEKVASILVIHDNAEARIGDHNKIISRYINRTEAESKAWEEQTKNLGTIISKKWKEYFDLIEKREEKEGIIAKDADWLETAFQAKEYVDLGYSAAEDWIKNVAEALETKSAKLILAEMKDTKFTDWWQGLKKMTYKKLNKN